MKDWDRLQTKEKETPFWKIFIIGVIVSVMLGVCSIVHFTFYEPNYRAIGLIK